MFYNLSEHHVKATLIDCDAEVPNDMLFIEGIKLKEMHVVLYYTMSMPIRYKP